MRRTTEPSTRVTARAPRASVRRSKAARSDWALVARAWNSPKSASAVCGVHASTSASRALKTSSRSASSSPSSRRTVEYIVACAACQSSSLCFWPCAGRTSASLARNSRASTGPGSLLVVATSSKWRHAGTAAWPAMAQKPARSAAH